MCSDCGPGAMQEQYKSRNFSSLSHPLLSPPSPLEQGEYEALVLLLISSFSSSSGLYQHILALSYGIVRLLSMGEGRVKNVQNEQMLELG